MPWYSPPGWWERLKPLARQMRTEPTPAESLLWEQLRDKRLGIKFRRQHAVERFIVDFYGRDAALIVEVDSPIHAYSFEEDALRQEFLEACGYTVLRFSNDEVLFKLDEVLKIIQASIGQGRPHP